MPVPQPWLNKRSSAQTSVRFKDLGCTQLISDSHKSVRSGERSKWFNRGNHTFKYYNCIDILAYHYIYINKNAGWWLKVKMANVRLIDEWRKKETKVLTKNTSLSYFTIYTLRFTLCTINIYCILNSFYKLYILSAACTVFINFTT